MNKPYVPYVLMSTNSRRKYLGMNKPYVPYVLMSTKFTEEVHIHE